MTGLVILCAVVGALFVAMWHRVSAEDRRERRIREQLDADIAAERRRRSAAAHPSTKGGGA